MEKFQNLYKQIISEAKSYVDPDQQYDRYRDSDQYQIDRKNREQDQAANHLKYRLQMGIVYNTDMDLCHTISQMIFDNVRYDHYFGKSIKNVLVLNKDYDLHMSYFCDRYSSELPTLTVTLEKYDQTGKFNHQLIQKWTTTAGRKKAEIITHNFHENKLYNPDLQPTTQEDIKQNLKQCEQFAKPICQFIKRNIKDLGKF